jgi:hypothetical protein
LLAEQEMIFLRTLEDLEKRIQHSDPYEVLGASALIRKLFLDDFPLVDQVNRAYGRKIEFDVGISKALRIPNAIILVQDTIDSDSSPPGTPKETVTRDQFFKKVVSKDKGREYTVKDIVLFEANLMGGVHVSNPKEEKERALQSMNQNFGAGGFRPTLRQLRSVGRVILKALRELREDVLKKASA